MGQMAERSHLSWQIDTGDARVRLSGEITEESDFTPLLERLPSEATLELSGVSRINSCGVREWITFLKALQHAGKKVVLDRCSVAMVSQLNMVSNFGGGSQITSVFGPYRCNHCDSEHQELIQLTDRPPRPPAAELPCPKCGKEMEFDDFPETYLSFMAP
jgi:anti-anti-sigma regulatory factor